MLVHSHSRPVRPPRVVILGARGFVAPALANGLAADGVDVVAVGSATLNLCEESSVAGLVSRIQPGDVVVMAAALTPEKGRDAGTMIRNVRMAEHVAAAMQARPFGQLVYLSSDAVYDGPVSPVSEDTPAAPGDLYGLMHRARELTLREAAGRTGVGFCVLRPCAIYGPGDTHNSYGPNRFVRSALKDRKIQIFGLGEETRDHVYIADVVRITRLAIAHGSSGVLNVVSGRTISFGDLARKVAELTGGIATIESLPRKGPVTHKSFDAAAVKESFPEHVPTPLDDGLRDTIAAFSHG